MAQNPTPIARRLDAIPLVMSEADRNERFPEPDLHERVQRHDTGCIEEWDGSDWVELLCPGDGEASCPVYCGTGSPEGVVTAAVGSLYYQRDAAATTHPQWVKREGTGTTGWRAYAGHRHDGTQSIAIGDSATATATNSTALGYQADATGSASLALGPHPSAAGSVAIAIGCMADAGTVGSIAQGHQAAVTGIYGTAIGYQASTDQPGALAIGLQAVAGGVVETTGSEALPADYAALVTQVAIGAGARTGGLTGNTAVGAGAEVLDAQVDYAHDGETHPTVAVGNVATAVGSMAKAGGDCCVAVGYVALTTHDFCTSVGTHAKSLGLRATAIGRYARAEQEESTALGAYTTAGGASAVAVGYNTEAGGTRATAVGRQALAGHDYGLALGAFAWTGAARQVMIGGGAAIGFPEPLGLVDAHVVGVHFNANATAALVVSSAGALTAVRVNNTQVLGSQGAAIADLAGGATLADTITAFNTLLARLRAHGLIAT